MPANPNPTYYDCTTKVLLNCVGTAGAAYVKNRVRTGVLDTVMVTCDSCNQKNKGSVSGGFGVTTVNTSWTINLPYGIGDISGGGDSQQVNLDTTLNCQDCKKVTAPVIKYGITVTMGVPYTVQKRVGYMSTTLGFCDPFDYVMTTLQCPGPYEGTTTFNTLEVELGATTELSCPPAAPPCCP